MSGRTVAGAGPATLAHRSIEAQRDAAAAALTGGVVAAMGLASLDEAVAVFDAIRGRLYPDEFDDEGVLA